MRTRLRLLAALPLAFLWLVPAPAQDPLPVQDQAPSPPAPARVLEGHFATGAVCALCHAASERATAMKDAQGRSVAPYDLWRSTMMANSARDPLWRAQVAAEVAALPGRKAEIEAECLTCHAPMAHHQARLGGEPLPDTALFADQGPRGALGRDGVSCTVCHQIRPERLGEPETFGGQLRLDTERRIYGPHADPVPGPMRMHTRYTPSLGPHLTRAALCGTCHTLFTDHHAADGSASGARLPEQTPYLEWRNSIFNDELETPGPGARSCQGCHVPTTDLDGQELETRLAHNPGGRDFPFLQPRRPVGRHVFVGGNVLVPAILRDHAAELGVEAPPQAFDATLAATRAQLERRTAQVRLRDVARAEGRVRARVTVTNLTGHKLPTGIPVRRLWLRARVRAAGGAVLVATGEHDAAGRIVGPDGAPLAGEAAGGPSYPHRAAVRAADEVQVWEAVLGDETGQPTYRLRRAARYLKDDRLLPRGWSAEHPDAVHTAPVGLDAPGSGADEDFTGGQDQVLLDLPLPAGTSGPLTLEVDVLYQPLSSRWAAELFTVDAPEVARFRGYWEQADRTPVSVASASAGLE